ncbi:MAG: hypothetical protein EBX39_11870 [Actinobacteria bacterium]|nr:hypothetical protein [Actinomycetota bacterium]
MNLLFLQVKQHMLMFLLHHLKILQGFLHLKHLMLLMYNNNYRKDLIQHIPKQTNLLSLNM